MILNPTDIGYPTCRPRQFTVMTLRNKCYLAEGLDVFIKEFACKVSVKAGALFACPLEYSRTVMQDLARKRGRNVAEDSFPIVTDTLAEYQKPHLQDYIDIREGWQGADKSYWFDVNQRPENGSKGLFLPCLVSHGTIVDLDYGMVAGGLQHMAMQGSGVWGSQRLGFFGDVGQDWVKMMNDNHISENGLKDLAGNAMFEPICGYLMAWLPCQLEDATLDDSDFATDGVEGGGGGNDGDGDNKESELSQSQSDRIDRELSQSIAEMGELDGIGGLSLAREY